MMPPIPTFPRQGGRSTIPPLCIICRIALVLSHVERIYKALRVA
jgi:hypothetical protein